MSEKEDLLDRYLDGVLAAEEELDVVSMLEADDEAQRYVMRNQQFAGLLKASPIESSEEFIEEIISKLNLRPEVEPEGNLFWQWLLPGLQLTFAFALLYNQPFSGNDFDPFYDEVGIFSVVLGDDSDNDMVEELDFYEDLFLS